MPSVTIGPEFFKKEFNEYENWQWAWVREIMQNSIDAKSTNIEFIVDFDGTNTTVTVKNNGEPMTQDILIHKLLALGASGKDFGSGAVGGFGKAKNILMFCHESWSVISGHMSISGVGGEYQIEDIEFFDGTITKVVMEGDQKEEISKQLRLFARYARWDGTLLLNDQILECTQNKGMRRRDLGFGVVFTNKSDQYRCVVRIGGIPMFVQYCGHDRLVIVELSGKSDELLTSNRDGLLSPYRGQLSSFITELSVDKKSALSPNKPKYVRFVGQKFSHQRRQSIDVRSIVGLTQSDQTTDSNVPKIISRDAEPTENSDTGSETPRSDMHVRASSIASDYSRKDRVTNVYLNHDFIIKNETNLVIPDYYRPDSSEFSQYSKKLVRFWGRIMIQLHRMFDRVDEFSIGFVFDENSEAQFEQRSEFGKVYYINPSEVVQQSSSYSKSFKKRFLLTERDRLIAIATHEFIHGSPGYDWHDERFAGKLTDMFGQIMKSRKDFNWCFK